MEKSERVHRDESPFQSRRYETVQQLGFRSKGAPKLALPQQAYESIMVKKNHIKFNKKAPVESIASKFPLAKEK